MREITKAEFLEGYKTDYIRGIVSIGNKVYGKDYRNPSEGERCEVVFCNI